MCIYGRRTPGFGTGQSRSQTALRIRQRCPRTCLGIVEEGAVASTVLEPSTGKDQERTGRLQVDEDLKAFNTQRGIAQ